MKIETLFNLIDNYDKTIYALKHYVYVFCNENDIIVDTWNWDNLITRLYNKMKNTYKDFKMSYEDFDLRMSEYLV